MDGVLLYDYQRDGAIRPGEAVLVYEDGSTARVPEKRNFPEVRIGEPKQTIRRRYFRSRPAGAVKHRTAHARQVTPRKRLPVCPFGPAQPRLFN